MVFPYTMIHLYHIASIYIFALMPCNINYVIDKHKPEHKPVDKTQTQTHGQFRPNSDRIQTEIHVQSLHTKDRTLKVSDRNMRRAKNPHPK